MVVEKFLTDQRTRAEDIILGALGFDQGSHVVTISLTERGFNGRARWADGEVFEFESDEVPGKLELWAIQVLSS